MQSTTQCEVSGLQLTVTGIKPYRVHDGLLGIERLSKREMQSGTIGKTESVLCSLYAAGDVLLDRGPTEGMEMYRSMEEYL